MGIENYSTIADNNDDPSPDGWPEAMAAAGVNNSARQNMADTRAQWNDAEWFEFGDGTPDGVVTFVANNQFKIVSPTSADVTGHWHVGRKVQLIDVSPLTTFATITATSFSVDTTTVTIDSTALTNVAITAFASTIPLVNTNLPSNPTFGTITAITGIELGGTGAANLLDDYEEGTFTPVPADAETGGNTGGGTNINGRYVKVGRLVHIQLNINNITTAGLNAPNDFFIQGLPFTSTSATGFNGSGAIGVNDITFAGNITAFNSQNTAALRIAETVSGASVDFVIVSQLSTGVSDIRINFTYETPS